MELRQLRYFVAVAESLNFSRAAEVLYISQSALSQQVADLEREMGVELLRRSKRMVELTDAGRLLLPEAKKLLYQSEKLIPHVRHAGQGQGEDREIFIGVDCSVDTAFCPTFRVLLTDTIYQLRKQVPGLRPVYLTCEYPELARVLDQGTCDLAVFLYPEGEFQSDKRLKLCSRVLREEEMVLVLRSDHPFADTPENVRAILEKRGLYLLERETKGMSQGLRILDELGIRPHIRFCDSRAAMILTAESGESATILPASLARGLRDPALRCLHFRTPAAVCNLLAVWREDNRNTLISRVVEPLAEKFTAG